MTVSPSPPSGVQTGVPLKRPLGITLLAIFYVLGGLVFVFGGIQSFLGGTYSFQLYVAFVWLALGWGMWKGKGWAWTLFLIDIVATFFLIVFSSLTVPTNLPFFGQLTYSLGTLAIDVLFFYYATRKNVKAFFGKTSIKSEFV